MIEIILTALGLSMDAMAVSVCDALSNPNMSRGEKLALPLAFGLFQGLMPLLGYFAGSVFADFFTQYAGVVTFVILGFIGGNMIREAIKSGGECSCAKITPVLVLTQAVATSIDAFAVGISFLANKTPIALAAPVTAAVTFCCSAAAVWLGSRFGAKLGNKAQILGGVVLVALGLKALLF